MVMNVRDHKLTLAAVLGSSNATRLPRAYVDRRAVEKAFAEGVATQTHIVVFGTPGVGKSALVRRNVDGSDLIFVECLRGQRAPDVYRSILSEVGARIRTETRLSKKKRLSATLKFFGADAERGTENTEAEITIDLGNVGDVFRILQSRGDRRHFVLLNNFHLLARGAQRRIVGDLQYVFERTGIRIIIVGNWTSPAYLADLNSFLPSFVTDVHVTTWSDDELVIALHKIEELLNVSFEADIADELIARSAGSVRELTDNCRLLLTAAGVESAQKSIKGIDNIEQLHEIIEQKMGRLVSRYAEMLSSYLTANLFTMEGVDIGKFFVRVASDLIAGMDDDDDEDEDEEQGEGEKRTTFSYNELNRALIDVVQASNEPPLAEQFRRQKLIEELATVIRRRGMNDLAISLRSAVDSQRPDISEEEYALQRSVKALIRTQAKYGFHPPLLAYDPHARSLIAIDPKFRVFLRIDSGEIEMLKRTDLVPIDQDQSYGWRSRWAAPIKGTAVTNRWLAQQRQQKE